MRKKAEMLSAFYCVCAFLSSTLLFAGSWKGLEALHFWEAWLTIWFVVVSPAGCIVLGVCEWKLLTWLGESRDAPFACQRGFLFLAMALSVSSWPVIAVKDFEELLALRQGLEASAAPGWASVTCTEDADPQGIDVATDRYTYFTLETSDWRVASEHASVVKRVGPTKTRKNGQVWGVAPIEYVGAVGRCRTKYPLFAACADPWFNKANCGWDTPNHNYGSLTYMRLLSAQVKIRDKDVFWDKWVPDPSAPSQKVKLHHENLFEYDTVSYDDAALIVAEKQEEYDTFVMAYA